MAGGLACRAGPALAPPPGRGRTAPPWAAARPSGARRPRGGQPEHGGTNSFHNAIKNL